MKLIVFILAIIFFALAQQKEQLITTDSLNVRSTPCTTGGIVKTLPPGTIVDFKGEKNTGCGYTWYKIYGSFGSGWAASNWLQPYKPGDVSKVVAYAEKQIGKGYSQKHCTGTPGECCRLGPNCFDCTGLVHMAWKQVGRNLPHSPSAYPSAGYRKITNLTTSSLRPADVLWREGHVGLYDGKGHVVQAVNENVGVVRTELGRYLRVIGASCAYRP